MHNRHLTATLIRAPQGAVLINIGLSLVFLLLWSIYPRTYQPVFQRLEQSQAIDDSKRVQSAIENEFASPAGATNDRASWDDTYTFAKHSHDYIESSYPVPALLSENSKVDLLAIYDRKGREMI